MEDEIKIGDTVIVSDEAIRLFTDGFNDILAGVNPMVIDIENGYATLRYNKGSIRHVRFAPVGCLTKFVEKKPNVGKITIPVGVELDDSFYETYTAELAKDIVLKVVDRLDNPSDIASWSVNIAKAVVENLKEG